MDKIMQDQIMNHKYHEFLYGKKTEERTKFLKAMVDRYPICYSKDEPMAIYLNPYGIEYSQVDYSSIDEDTKLRLGIFAREYLEFLLIKQVISKIESNSDIMDQIEKELLNYLTINIDKKTITSVKEYLKLVEEAIEIYNISYNNLVCGKDMHPLIGEVPIFAYDLPRYFKAIKKILHNKEQFNIIIDYQKEVTLDSIKAINNIIYSRCTSSLCMKVATECDKWPSYNEFTGRFVENIHDYTIVELDDSFSKSLERKRKLYLNEEED